MATSCAQLHDCDATTGWNVATGSLAVDTGDKQEGTGSLKNTSSGNGADIFYLTNWDGSGYSWLRFWLKPESKSSLACWLNDGNGKTMNWTTKLTDQVTAGEWNEVNLLFNDYNAMDSGFDVSSIDSLEVLIGAAGAYDLWIDDLRLCKTITIGDWGVKVSKTGYDVKFATDEQLALSSKWNSYKVFMQGVVTETVAINSEYCIEVAHNLGYPPAHLVFGERNPGDNKRYAANYEDNAGYCSTWLRMEDDSLFIFVTTGALVTPGTWHGYYYIFNDPLT